MLHDHTTITTLQTCKNKYQASAAENKFMLCQELNTCECAQHSTIIFSALHWQWRFLPQIEFMTSKPACNKLLLWGQHEY